MIYCSECGEENPDNKRFCGGCGAPLSVICPKCKTENLPTNRFCANCGHKMSAPKSKGKKTPKALRKIILESTKKRLRKPEAFPKEVIEKTIEQGKQTLTFTNYRLIVEVSGILSKRTMDIYYSSIQTIYHARKFRSSIVLVSALLIISILLAYVAMVLNKYGDHVSIGIAVLLLIPFFGFIPLLTSMETIHIVDGPRRNVEFKGSREIVGLINEQKRKYEEMMGYYYK